HFLAAKSVGIRVEAFSLGYPPTALRKQVGETEYRLSWIPFGGYVKMAGMIDEGLEGESSLTGAPWEFSSKNTGQKLWVITAGVLMNLLLAILIYTGITAARGVAEPEGTFIGAVSAGDPADEAGLQAGDRILVINGVTVTTWEEMVDEIYAQPEEELLISYEREREVHDLALTSLRRMAEVDGEIREVGLIGINPQLTYRPASLGEIVTSGFIGTAWVVKMVGTSIGMLLSGQASVRDLGGPMLIAKMSGESAKQGLTAFLGFIAFVSVNIGCLNLLPVPALDGGHALIILTEGALRRELPVKFKLAIQQVGMVLLFALIVFIIINDAERIFGFGWIKELFGR
ncbi:MAG: RIP metalloprotease RseP, partial [Candidatus Eisenbacteria bacterium]|nr:RIP metalloprotease RseP [Candidatus Eisenbacteria bacterium]